MELHVLVDELNFRIKEPKNIMIELKPVVPFQDQTNIKNVLSLTWAESSNQIEGDQMNNLLWGSPSIQTINYICCQLCCSYSIFMFFKNGSTKSKFIGFKFQYIQATWQQQSVISCYPLKQRLQILWP